jgi:hypothetical protein
VVQPLDNEPNHISRSDHRRDDELDLSTAPLLIPAPLLPLAHMGVRSTPQRQQAKQKSGSWAVAGNSGTQASTCPSTDALGLGCPGGDSAGEAVTGPRGLCRTVRLPASCGLRIANGLRDEHRVEAVAERRVGLREQVAIAVQHEAGRGVPGPHRDLFRGGAGRNPQRHRCMAEIVDA